MVRGQRKFFSIGKPLSYTPRSVDTAINFKTFEAAEALHDTVVVGFDDPIESRRSE